MGDTEPLPVLQTDVSDLERRTFMTMISKDFDDS